MKELPGWLSAYLVAGIFSAAMCSESSALNSLASALSLDFVSPLMGKAAVEGRRGLVLGKVLTLFWTVVLAGLAVGFSLMPQGIPAVQVALSLASVTGGGLLGAFLLALYVRRARQADALVAIGVSALFMFVLWLGGARLRSLRARERDRLALVLDDRRGDHGRGRVAPVAPARRPRGSSHA